MYGIGAIPVQRGCGVRVAGGIYWETGLSPVGRPLEDFIMDPPVPVSLESLGISEIGVHIIRRPNSDVYDVWDVVGAEHYPNVADMLEEVRRFGLSRRMRITSEFERLTPESKIIMLHRRAWIENAHEYLVPPDGTRFSGCPRELPAHRVGDPPQMGDALPAMCAGVWWDDVEDGVPVGDDPRLVDRKMPWGEYRARIAPDGVTPQYRMAVFARFPLTRLVVVRDPEGNRHEAALDRLRKAAPHLPHELVDE